jgi:gluconolactonase
MTTLIAEGSTLEKLYSGTAWAEGPVYVPQTNRVRWSDIPNNRIMELDIKSGQTRVYREKVENTNGRTLDLDGAVVQCSHGRRTVEREVARDEQPITLVDSFEGKRLNSPNDVVVASDGTIWFTDPPYGILSDWEGHPGELQYGGCYVFRFDEKSGELTAVITDLDRPNGLAFSPDESVLYVANTSDDYDNQTIRAYDVVSGEGGVGSGGLANGRFFAQPRPGMSDGFRVDVEGRIWTSAGDAVHVYSPSGLELLTIPVPETIANLCFGGPDYSDLYVTATTSLYRITTTTRGLSH